MLSRKSSNIIPKTVSDKFNISYFNLIFVAFVLIEIIVFFLISGFQSTVPLYHDNFKLGYSYRVLLSTSIQNGIFPLWDHWVNGGHPMNSLYTGLNFSPIFLFLSLFGVYSIKTYIVEILIFHTLGLIGMYKWLRLYVDKYVALFGAICFSLAFYFIQQAPINSEALFTESMLPWVALGLKIALSGNKKGIGVLAIALWIMFTSGYLGINVIQIQFIYLFCIVEFLFFSIDWKKPDYKLILKSIIYTLFGTGLFILIINFMLFETYSYYQFDLSQIRNGIVNPYNGSIRLDTIFSSLLPNYVNVFTPDKYGGSTGIIYFGSLSVFFILYAVSKLKKDKKIILLLVFAFISFVSMLSNEFLLGRLFTEIIPFYNKIQYHGWNAPLYIFFAVMLSCIGIKLFFQQKKHSIKFIIIFIGIYLFFSFFQSDTHDILKYLLYPQSFIVLIFIIYYFFIYKTYAHNPDIAHYPNNNRHKMKYGRKYKTNLFKKPHILAINNITLHIVLLTVVIIIEVCFVSQKLVRANYNPTVYKDLYYQLEETKHNKFDVLTNQRLENGYYFNLQYYDKYPVIDAYNPSIHPYIFNLKNIKNYIGLLEYIFYQVDEKDLSVFKDSVKVDIKKFTPNQIKVDFTSPVDNIKIVWSSPYTPNWEVSSNEKVIKTWKNQYGLTAFTLSKGYNNVTLIYKPPYMIYSFIVCVIGVVVSLLLLILPRRYQSGKGELK